MVDHKILNDMVIRNRTENTQYGKKRFHWFPFVSRYVHVRNNWVMFVLSRRFLIQISIKHVKFDISHLSVWLINLRATYTEYTVIAFLHVPVPQWTLADGKLLGKERRRVHPFTPGFPPTHTPPVYVVGEGRMKPGGHKHRPTDLDHGRSVLDTADTTHTYAHTLIAHTHKFIGHTHTNL